MAFSIRGVRCTTHNVELTHAPTGDPKLDKMSSKAMRAAVEKHKHEAGGGCKIVTVTS